LKTNYTATYTIQIVNYLGL